MKKKEKRNWKLELSRRDHFGRNWKFSVTPLPHHPVTLSLHYPKVAVICVLLSAVICVSAYAAEWPANLNEGLVTYWNFEQDPSGTAPQLTDRVGSNDGTAEGSMTADVRVSGKVGYCWNLDGLNDYVIKNSHSLPVGNSARTFSFWTYVNATHGGYFMTYGAYTAGQYWGPAMRPNGQLGFMGHSSGDWDGICTISNNSWHHIVLTYDGTTLVYYKDNIKVGEHTYAYNTGINLPFIIGAWQHQISNWSVSSFLNARMDELGIWSRVLTTAEITQLYNNGNGITYVSPGLSISVSGGEWAMGPIRPDNEFTSNQWTVHASSDGTEDISVRASDQVILEWNKTLCESAPYNGYWAPDGLDGYGCWFIGDDNESCTSACTGRGLICATSNWNDSTTCAVCGHLIGQYYKTYQGTDWRCSEWPETTQGNEHATPAWGLRGPGGCYDSHCRYRRAGVAQKCGDVGGYPQDVCKSGARRICVCGPSELLGYTTGGASNGPDTFGLKTNAEPIVPIIETDTIWKNDVAPGDHLFGLWFKAPSWPSTVEGEHTLTITLTASDWKPPAPPELQYCIDANGYWAPDGLGGYGCWFKGNAGESCTEVCDQQSLQCQDADWDDNNTCEIAKHFVPDLGSCWGGESYTHGSYPVLSLEYQKAPYYSYGLCRSCGQGSSHQDCDATPYKFHGDWGVLQRMCVCEPKPWGKEQCEATRYTDGTGSYGVWHDIGDGSGEKGCWWYSGGWSTSCTSECARRGLRCSGRDFRRLAHDWSTNDPCYHTMGPPSGSAIAHTVMLDNPGCPTCHGGNYWNCYRNPSVPKDCDALSDSSNCYCSNQVHGNLCVCEP